MLSKVRSTTIQGLNGIDVAVECDSSKGLPGIVVVGLGSKSVDESKERIRSALKNAKLKLPPRKFTINLAPANIPKNGTRFDLAIAIAMLVSTGQIEPESILNSVFIGELGLDGEIRPVHGVLASLLHTQSTDQTFTVYVAPENADEASMLTEQVVIAPKNLTELYRHLIGEIKITTHTPAKHSENSRYSVDFDDVTGQTTAKRALMIAAAGNHNLLMSGPPGTGKTTLAKAFRAILPRLSPEETLTVLAIHSLTGAQDVHKLQENRPFREPHHSSSLVSIIGGGSKPGPGEVSLAHNGVLFLDELPEYNRSSLEALRQPLEDKFVTVSRAAGTYKFPANFTLIATRNPCPCGYYGDPKRECSCSAHQINIYNKKLSGPLMDRIDMHIPVGRVEGALLSKPTTSKTNQTKLAKNQVSSARLIQKERFQANGVCNGDMSNRQVIQFCKLSEDIKKFLDSAVEKMQLSPRTYMRTLKVARTIADIEESEDISLQHIAEALSFREQTSTI